VTAALGLEPEAVEQASDGEPPYYLFRVTEKVASTIPPLDEVKAGIVETLTRDKAKEAARTAAEALLESARKGEGATTLVAEATANGWEVGETGPFGRNEQIPKLPGAPVKNDAFALTAESPLATRAFVGPDAAILLALKERTPADPATMTDEQRRDIRDHILARKRQDVLEAYRNGLRERAEITVNPDVMARAAG
jgi:peptidyl-prolyl cis-trans isomerase D